MRVTIGGNRVGSGKKMQAELHNYYRSTHNLSQKFASSMASGVLYPALCEIAMRGDSFDININADIRTIPTIGPLFGSYKLQVDVYQCPIRLYQGILHNNPLAIGLNMDKVKLPKIKVESRVINGNEGAEFNESSLLRYLGMTGLGTCASSEGTQTIGRNINAIPALAYYDIFKTYYANKQEDKAFVIGVKNTTIPIGSTSLKANGITYENAINGYYTSDKIEKELASVVILNFNNLKETLTRMPTLGFYINFYDANGGNIRSYNFTLERLHNIYNTNEYPRMIRKIYWEEKENRVMLDLNYGDYTNVVNVEYKLEENVDEATIEEKLALNAFNLSNIDDMRYSLLCSNTLGTTFVLDGTTEGTKLPYSTLTAKDNNKISYNTYAMNGLVVKTYQNDIFNNWLNAEWIEGANGINELSKVAVTDGKFSMDALAFAKKLYNMLNRIAISGGTYEDWQDSVYETVKRRQIESPIFLGGMSQEIMFDEIIQTSGGDGEETGTLGTLGGRGKNIGQSQKGGKIHVKCDEACFIMAIVSLTPRVFYSQGNRFYMTELDSLNDLHKPEMDGIGFQDLIGERMAWWDTIITPSSTSIIHRSKIGKLPAWIEYMTAYDRAYGDFAKEYGKTSLCLLRNYERGTTKGSIGDATTYVDPQKFNYSFAYQALDAQNFWCMIGFNIKARRLMSARLIPNV